MSLLVKVLTFIALPQKEAPGMAHAGPKFCTQSAPEEEPTP
jgi:hypothetical protein